MLLTLAWASEFVVAALDLREMPDEARPMSMTVMGLRGVKTQIEVLMKTWKWVLAKDGSIWLQFLQISWLKNVENKDGVSWPKALQMCISARA